MKVTPMMQQYFAAKEHHPDAVLFFRMGDFYEMFFEDAVVVSRELGLTLTARNKGDDDEVPMAGVPHHAATGYVNRLIDKGFSVAICEQLEDPSQTKGIVKRGVVRVVTPGVVLDTDSLEAKAANFVAAIYTEERGKPFGVAYADISTGDFRATEVIGLDALRAELTRIEPREVLMNAAAEAILSKGRARVVGFPRVKPDSFFDPEALSKEVGRGARYADDVAHDAFFLDQDEVKLLLDPIDGASFAARDAVASACAGILSHVVATQRGIPAHARPAQPYRSETFLVVDDATKANLELVETLMGGRHSGSLLSVIDKTVTAMGGRLLRQWLNYPLVEVDEIEARLSSVSELVGRPALRDDIRGELDKVYDLERLCGKVSSGTANARDLRSLVDTLEAVDPIRDLLRDSPVPLLAFLCANLEPFDDLREVVGSALVDNPPTSLTEGGLFRRGFDDELDEVLELSENGKDWILRYEQQERTRTGITSLKVRYNKVFGYYIEVTKANLSMVPDDYVRKQTLANAERYFTLDLKEMEEKILGAEGRRRDLEYRLFEELRRRVGSQISELLETARLLANIDVLSAFAELAVRNDYVRPKMADDGVIEIEDGRHPVVEKTMTDEKFVPNTVLLDPTEHRLQIITGPNMAGKSTVIRQVALIVLMAQMGCYVPARSARIGVVDKIFSRVGASDNLARGQSTFMVEMTEAAHILGHATSRSLVILDEIGRGTSTFDGLSIAWAVAEYLHDELRAKTMFATHYHELTELTRTLDAAENLSIAVKEWNDDIIFLRKLVSGEANRSYGVQVARLAGLPAPVVERAKAVLENLEAGQFDEMGIPLPARGRPAQATQRYNPDQLTLFSFSAQLSPEHEAVLEELRGIDVDTLTPLEALNLIARLRRNLDA